MVDYIFHWTETFVDFVSMNYDKYHKILLWVLEWFGSVELLIIIYCIKIIIQDTYYIKSSKIKAVKVHSSILG